jgi:hypothetical protein
MPRLSTKDYLKAHKQLRYFWLHRQSLYRYLQPTQQWQLHAFFRPSEELSKEELLQHRKMITAVRPSLPHQAGRALKELEQVMHHKVKPRGVTTMKVKSSHKGTATIGVHSIVRPQIDHRRLARALIELERGQSKHKH